MGSLGMCLQQDGNAMGDTTNFSPCISSTCAQNAMISSLMIQIIPSHQINVAINNPSLIPPISYWMPCWFFWNSVCTADDVSHTENLHKLQDRIQVTRVFGIVVSARANQYTMNSPSLFRSLFWILVPVTMGDAHSACQNPSQGIAVPIPSNSVDPIRARSCFMCIDTSQIQVHLLNPQLEP